MSLISHNCYKIFDRVLIIYGFILRLLIRLAVAVMIICGWPDKTADDRISSRLPKRSVIVRKAIPPSKSFMAETRDHRPGDPKKPDRISPGLPKRSVIVRMPHSESFITETRDHHPGDPKPGKPRCRICLKPLAIIEHRPVEKPIPMDISPFIRRYVVGASNENRPISCLVTGQGEDAVLIMASVHGDETAGTPLVRRMGEYLRRHPEMLEARKVMLLPMVNPDGEKRNSRYNARGVDLNRNFSAANRRNSRRHGFSALSEPETRAIVRAIRQCNPKRVIVLHQPLACIDYDGPGKKLAEHISKYSNLPVRKLGAMPGSLGSYAGVELGIPTITFELPGNLRKMGAEHAWKRYGPALIASILYPGGPELLPVKEHIASEP